VVFHIFLLYNIVSILAYPSNLSKYSP